MDDIRCGVKGSHIVLKFADKESVPRLEAESVRVVWIRTNVELRESILISWRKPVLVALRGQGFESVDSKPAIGGIED